MTFHRVFSDLCIDGMAALCLYLFVDGVRDLADKRRAKRRGWKEVGG